MKGSQISKGTNFLAWVVGFVVLFASSFAFSSSISFSFSRNGVLELGSVVLVVSEVFGSVELTVNIVDIVEECDFRELIYSSISAITVLPCSRSFFMSSMKLLVHVTSSLIFVQRLSTIVWTHIWSYSSHVEMVSRYSLKSITMYSSSLSLSRVVIVEILWFSR